MPETTEYVTTKQIAGDLGFHVRTVHRDVEAGLLVAAAKAPGPRGAYLFDQAEVARYKAERAESAGAA